MPTIRLSNRIVETEDDGPCGPVRIERISEAGGLTQFGALIETLPPGSSSSIKHWHTEEDEVVYVLDGEVTLLEGDAEILLQPGDAATFRAGDPVGHCLVNRSDGDVKYLVIGTRAARDEVTYPDHDRRLIRDRSAGTTVWTDLAGAPASNAYDE